MGAWSKVLAHFSEYIDVMKVVRFLRQFFITASACVTLSGCMVGGFGLSGTLDGPQASNVILNDYISPVALPLVTVQVTAADSNPTGIAKICISETSSTCPSTSWQNYNPSISYELTPLSGSHTVYVWLMDGVGNIGGPFPSTNSVVLDYANAPLVTVTSPAATANFIPGASLTITWSCIDSAPLETNPVAITYTADDGVTFSPPIASNLPPSGSFVWDIPVTAYNSMAVTTSTPLRVLVSCTSQAGVTNSSFAPVINTGASLWSVFMGDPEYLWQNVNSLLADTSNTSTAASVTADSQNNIYYVKNNAIMVVNHATSLITTFAGSLNSSGCTMNTGSTPASATLTSPIILGMDTTLTNLLVLNGGCNLPSVRPIFSINTQTNAVTLWANLGAAVTLFVNAGVSSPTFFLTKDRILVLESSSGYVYTLNLSTQGNSPVAVHGNGSVSSTPYANGTDITTQPIFCTSCSAGTNNSVLLWANDDASKIWIDFYLSAYGYRIDASGGGHYVIGVSNSGFHPSSQANTCTRTEFDSYVYCPARGGLGIHVYDPSTPGAGGWLPQGGTMPFTNNDNSGYLVLGTSQSNLLGNYTLGNIDLITPSQTVAWDYVNVAGQPLSIMGNSPPNPINKSAVGLLNPLDIHYDASHQYLWISTNSDIRKVDFTNSYSTSTFFTNLGTDQGQYNINMNIAGTKFGEISQYCGGEDATILDYTVGATSMTQGPAYLGGVCGGSPTDMGYPPPASYTVASSGLHPYIYAPAGGGWMDFLFFRPVYHSSGKILFSGSSPLSNVMLFSTDGTTVLTIGGVAGPGGHNAGQSGSLATSVQLTHVWQMQEIATGPYAGDVLLWDGDWLRRLSYSTESANPKIYDLYNYNSMAGGSHPAGTAFYDVIYDQSTETGGVLGTGNTYYVDSSNGVHKFVPNVAMTTGTETAYSFVGTTFTGIARLALTPAGLLVLEPNKSRILVVSP